MNNTAAETLSVVVEWEICGKRSGAGSRGAKYGWQKFFAGLECVVGGVS